MSTSGIEKDLPSVDGAIESSPTAVEGRTESKRTGRGKGAPRSEGVARAASAGVASSPSVGAIAPSPLPAAAGAGAPPIETTGEPTPSPSEPVAAATKPEARLPTFEAITAFVSDLWEVHRTDKKTPLALYNRILSNIRLTDGDAIDKTIVGFANFFHVHGEKVLTDKMDEIPVDTRILYGSKTATTIYLDISRIWKKSDSDSRIALRAHLLAIQGRLDPNTSTLKELEKLMGAGGEGGGGEGFGGILTGMATEFTTMMKDVPDSDPEAALDKVIESGMIKKLFRRIKGSVDRGEIDPSKVVSSFGGMKGLTSLLGSGGGKKR